MGEGSTDLITHFLSTDEFLQTLVKQLISLKSHPFISKIQAHPFREQKEKLTDFECIADFTKKLYFYCPR